MRAMKYLAVVFLLMTYASTASSVEVKKFTCTATHHSVDAAGNDDAKMIGNNIKVTDIGTSFTAIIGTEKIHSSSLMPVTKNGETALVGKDGDTYYTKIDGNYVIQNKGKGYVISDCK